MFIHYLIVCATLLMSSVPVCQSVISMPSKKQITQQARPEMEQPNTIEFQDELQAQKQMKHSLKKGAHAAPENSDAEEPDFFDMLFSQKPSSPQKKAPATPWYQRLWNGFQQCYSFVDEICTVDLETRAIKKDEEKVQELTTSITRLKSQKEHASGDCTTIDSQIKTAETQKKLLEDSLSHRKETVGQSFSDKLGMFAVNQGFDVARRQAYEYVTGNPDFTLKDATVNVFSTMRRLAPSREAKMSLSTAKHAALVFQGHAQSRFEEFTQKLGSFFGSFLHTKVLKPFILDKIQSAFDSTLGNSSELARGFVQRVLFSDGVRSLIKTHVLKTETDNHPILFALKHADIGLFGFRTYKIVTQMREKAYGFDLKKIGNAVLKGHLSVHSLKNLFYEVCGLSVDLASLLEKHLPAEEAKKEATTDASSTTEATPQTTSAKQNIAIVARKTLAASKYFVEGLRSLITSFDKSFKGCDLVQTLVQDYARG